MSPYTIEDDNKKVSTAINVADDAVSMPKNYWFVVMVNHRSEKQISEKLSKMEITNYLLTQTERWSLAVISDIAIERLKFMLGQSYIPI